MNLRALNKSHKKAFKGKTIPLIDLCLAISDCPHYTPNWTESGELVIRNFNIKGGRLDLKEKYYTDKETFADRIRRHKPEPGDLIITREAPMGEVCIIPDGIECCLGQRMVLIKPNPKKVNNRYLLYAMLSEFVQKQIRKSDSSGSIVSNLCIPDLEQLSIPYVPLNEQEKIALILDPIFENIEINDKITSELENLAKTIYNYWFVQFDFPNEKGKPYKTSGGEMEWNDEMKRDIPKEWKFDSLKRLFEIQSGYPFESEDYRKKGDYKLITIKNVQDGFLDTNETDFIEFLPKNLPDYCKLKLGDLLMSLTGNVGRVCIVTEENLLLNQRVGVVIPQNQCLAFTYFTLQSDFIVKTLKKIATGSNQKNLSPIEAGEEKALQPDENIVKLFEKKTKPFFDMILKNQRENQELIKLRDFLLPMLMNGQVKVKSEAKEQLSMAAEPQAEYKKSRT